jgi:hypothetical protein
MQGRKNTIEDFYKNVAYNPETGCDEWIGALRKNGYGQFSYDGVKYLVHRLRYMFYYGFDSIPEGNDVCHTCDNRKCVTLDHLWVGTRQQNMDDMVYKGRSSHLIGEKNGRSKLTKEKVCDMRYNYKQGGISQKELSDVFGVNKTTISNILNNKRWKE